MVKHTNVTVDHEALKAIPHRGITTTDLIESATRRAQSVERIDPRLRGLYDEYILRMERASMLVKGQRIGEMGDSFEEWAQHYDSVVSVDHVGTLRHALEPHELFELPDGQALAISGTTMAMLKLPGWWGRPCGGRCLECPDTCLNCRHRTTTAGTCGLLTVAKFTSSLVKFSRRQAKSHSFEASDI